MTVIRAEGLSGRPPATTRWQLGLVAVRLFHERGFEETTVDEIAAAAGVSRRTFFRYFPTKSSVLWNDFEQEVQRIRSLLAATPHHVPIAAAVRAAVIQANRYSAEDLPDLRARMTLIGTVPSLQASATLHYHAWAQAITDFVAQRTGLPAESLYPLAVGRSTLAVCQAAYEVWAATGDGALVHYLDQALSAQFTGFDPPTNSNCDPGDRAANST